ncbi:MAG: type I restriction enzyme HsdR N-terminal domain-containing protein [Bacteroidales bacterium]
MEDLQIPYYQAKIEQRGEKKYIFDPFRKQYVALTPEEWVRQQFLSWLCNAFGYPKGLIAVETPLRYNELKKRADAVIYNRQLRPVMIIEVKSTQVNITQETFEQAVRYNFAFKTPYIILTNGITHYCCFINHEQKKVEYLSDIPPYPQIIDI